MWFRKFSALMLVSLGAALVYLPFPAQLEGERSQEVVQLEVWDAPFSREDVEADFGDGFVELDYEGLEATPEMLEAVLSLMGESGARCVSSSDWHLFLGDRSLVDPVGLRRPDCRRLVLAAVAPSPRGVAIAGDLPSGGRWQHHGRCLYAEPQKLREL